MSSLDEIKIELKGIGDILRNNYLSVPTYQRVYAWEDRHVLELIQDLQNALDEKAKEYFLGTIVISQSNNKRPEIADGQQRLATITILLSAVRDYFFREKETVRYNNVSDFLTTADIETTDETPRLQLNQSDHDFFYSRVLTPPDSPQRAVQATRDSHRRIEAACTLAKKHVDSVAAVAKDPSKRLAELVTYIRSNAKVIWVRVPDDTNAFSIFETLNDRGLRLALTDLLKNYLFARSDDRINEVQEWWISMTSVIEAAESEEMIVTFIRQHWSSVHGATREKELYKDIKAKVTTKKQAIDFARQLNSSSRLYAAILNSQHELWADYGQSAREHMATLNELGLTQLRPLLLAIIELFPPKETQLCLKLLLAWSVRFLIVGGLGGGALESQYCKRAVDIRKGTLKTAHDVFTAMKNVVPNDTEFTHAFSVATVSKDNLARYYLRTLETHLRGKKEPEFVPNKNQETLTLEHILPENLSPAWEHIKPEDAQAYYRRIGNLTLLAKRINSEEGNKGFPTKRSKYAKSELSLNAEIAALSTWGLKEIDQRQKHLADLAVSVWPVKP